MRAADLRGILGYTSVFRNKLFVISLDSEVIEDANFKNVILDISVLRSLNVHLALVHGASSQVQQLSKSLGVAPTNLDGMGMTDRATLDVSVLGANRLSHAILEECSEVDLRAAVTNAVIAHPTGILGGKDFGWTGRVERVDTAFLQCLLDGGIVPVIPPLGYDGEGRTYRVNSDGVALELAKALKAAKLIYVGTTDGVREAGSLQAQFSIAEAESYLKKNAREDSPYVRSKLEHALAACRSGVNRAHLIDGRKEEALLAEIFSNEGVGTMIYANEYEAIRRARKKDVRAIKRLIKQSVQAEEVVTRTEEEIARCLADFALFEIDRNVVGCAALHLDKEDPTRAEIACVVVEENHANQGIGRKLIQYLEEQARTAGVRHVFLLSTRAFNYFQQKAGYQEADLSALPPERRQRYEASGRNSRILAKELSAEKLAPQTAPLP